MTDTLLVYHRPDGRVAIRNFMAVISASDAANPVARRLAGSVPEAVAITPLYGRGQLGEDFALSVRTMVGLGTNPNVYAVLVVGLEPVAAERIAQGIARTGKRVEVLSIQKEGGTPRLFGHGSQILHAWAGKAAHIRRQPATLAELSVGLECGGSDTTSGLVANPAIGLVADRLIDAGGTAIFSEPVECLGGEAILSARTKDKKVTREIVRTIKKYEVIAQRAGVDLNRTNPAPDNIRGGLTTIEEKSLGSISKSGSRPIRGVLAYGQAPPRPGLYLMDAPAPATENITALAAAGVQVILFGTGVGNSIGNPVVPTIKVCGNPVTCRTLGTHIDVDLSAVITRGLDLTVAADRVQAALLKVVEGKRTRCEVLGETETAISRIGPSV
ncbi:MAG: UxaA family hydrolase [Candidatus Methylomirabilales bacterium]